MATTPSNDPYIQTLKEKFLSARRDAISALEMLKGARRREEIYGETLKAEGVNTATLGNGHAPSSSDIFALSGQIDIPVPEKPLSGNHALQLIMKAHGNVGFTFGDLKRHSDEMSYGLTEKDIRSIYWRLLAKKMVEKLPDGKIRLTKKGEEFNRFRMQKMP